MLELFNSLVDLKQQLGSILTGEAGFFTYLIIFLVPFCIVITIREFMCWFSKRNHLINRVSKLEKLLVKISNQLENLPTEIEKAKNKDNFKL